MFTLTDHTTGHSWEYDTEGQLRAAARLFVIAHPKSEVSMTINGERLYAIRKNRAHA